MTNTNFDFLKTVFINVYTILRKFIFFSRDFKEFYFFTIFLKMLVNGWKEVMDIIGTLAWLNGLLWSWRTNNVERNYRPSQLDHSHFNWLAKVNPFSTLTDYLSYPFVADRVTWTRQLNGIPSQSPPRTPSWH